MRPQEPLSLARSRPRAVIFDIDGTLSSAAHRAPLVSEGQRDWSGFHGAMVLDAPIEHTIRKLKAHKRAGDRIVLLSMRPERFRKHTESWMRSLGVPYDRLYLRPENDYRRGDAAKMAIFRENIEPEFDVSVAYDDRPDVLAMWSVLGIEGRPVTDPGLPPFEGLPASDPKYPNGRRGTLVSSGVGSGLGGVGRAGTLVYVRPHERVVDGQIQQVEGYFRRLSAVERLERRLVSLGRRAG